VYAGLVSRSVPSIFDRRLLRQRLRRATRQGFADFLLRRSIEELEHRLDATLRPFPRALDLFTPTPALAEALANRPAGHAVNRLALLSGEPATPRWGACVQSLRDDETLPFEPESFDLIVSSLALQWIDDLPGLLTQARRLLAPDGLLLACLAGGQTLHELRAVFAQAEAELCGGASPRVAPFADLRDLGGLLQRAGFALPVADIDTVTVRYDNMFALIADLRAMGATSILTQRAKAPLRRTVAMRAAELYAGRFADADGRIRATFEIVWISGWAPHASQQQPLKPGSARMRLADALRTGPAGGSATAPTSTEPRE